MEAYQYTIRKIKEIEEKKSLPFNINDVSLKNTSIKNVDQATAKKIIIEYEWLKTIPLFNKYFFGIYFNINGIEHLGGIVIYSEEYSANKSKIWDKYTFTNKLLLLSRGVCLWWTPKNTASYFITKTIKWIRNNTKYKILTATVDPAAGEIGTIYQALNWNYVGLMRGNYGKNGRESKRFSVYIDGKLKHSRSIRNEFGTIKKDVILKKYPNALFVPQYRKRRYFYFIGDKNENRNFYNKIKYLLLPYPKKTKEICGVIYSITNKINNKMYIGQTTRGFYDRYDEYRRNASSCNTYLLKAFNKYGFNNFDFNIIETAENLNELNEKEIQFIKHFNTTNRNLGYNIESGGVHSPANKETKTKLSKARKEIKQSPEHIKKRVDQISKPVIKLKNNFIVEEYMSLANAGKNNKNNLSYEAINRLCLALSKNNDEYIWCYKEDFINNTIPIYKKIDNREFNSLLDEEINNIYNKYKNGGFSIRGLSKEHNINFLTLFTYIKKKEKPESIFKENNNYIAICKKTNKEFVDYINKSGILTTHIKKIYPDFILESKFKRKQIEMKTGKPWYYSYFKFNKI